MAVPPLRCYNEKSNKKTVCPPQTKGGALFMKQTMSFKPLLALCWLTYVISYLGRVNLSTAITKMADGLSVSVEYLGAAGSIYFICYAVGQLINGFLGDRVDPPPFLMLALGLTGSVNVLLAMQTGGGLVLPLWGINGFCQSMFWSTLLRLLALYSDDSQRKLVSSVMFTCAVTGYFLSWVVLNALFQSLTFRPYFYVPGLLALALIPVWWLVGRRGGVRTAAERTATLPLPQLIGEIVRDRLYFVGLLGSVIGAVQEGAVFWMPLIFTELFDLGENALSLLVSVPAAKLLGVFLAQWVLSLARDNVRTAMILTQSFACVLTVLLLLTSHQTSLLTVLLIAGLIAAANASNWYNVSYFPLSFSARGMVSTLVGCFDFSAYVGAAIMSGVLGGLLTQYGWVALPTLWLGLCLLGLTLALTGAGSCLRREGKPRQTASSR